MRRLLTVFLACIVVAVLVSGCSGKPTATPGATPTPVPPSGTPLPSPTWTAVESPAQADQMFNLGSLHWYQFRSGLSSETVNLSSLYRFEYSDEVYKGTDAKRTRIIINDTVSGLESVVDYYTSRPGGDSLGGTVRSFIFGTPTGETDLAPGQGQNYLDKDLYIQARGNSKAPLTAAGQEKVTVDGTTYTCTKYAYTEDGITYTVWHAPQAPMPVKMQWTDKGASNTVELLNWS